jgi:hypothetical protein
MKGMWVLIVVAILAAAGVAMAQDCEVGLELITNGTFDASTGWSTYWESWASNSVTFSGGKANFSSGGSADVGIYQTVTLRAGSEYQLKLDFTLASEAPVNNGLEVLLAPEGGTVPTWTNKLVQMTADDSALWPDGATEKPWVWEAARAAGTYSITKTFVAANSGPQILQIINYAWPATNVAYTGDFDNVSLKATDCVEPPVPAEPSGFMGGWVLIGSTIEMCAPDDGFGYSWSFTGNGSVWPDEELMNPAFGSADGWTIFATDWAGGTGDITGGKFNVHHGTMANVGVYQTVTLEKGAQYTISGVFELTSQASNFGAELLAIDPSVETIPPAGDWGPYRVGSAGDWSGDLVGPLSPVTIQGSYTAPGTVGEGTVDIAICMVCLSWTSSVAWEATVDNISVVPVNAGMPLGFAGATNAACLTLENVTNDYTGIYTCAYDDGSKAPATYSVHVEVVDQLPVMGLIGFGVLISAAALGGGIAIRKKRHSH